MTIAETLREARRKLGLTQAEVAAACGVTQAAVAGWESGDSAPRADRIRCVAKAYRVRPIDLIPEAG